MIEITGEANEMRSVLGSPGQGRISGDCDERYNNGEFRANGLGWTVVVEK
jgi:hypothetical protein